MTILVQMLPLWGNVGPHTHGSPPPDGTRSCWSPSTCPAGGQLTAELLQRPQEHLHVQWWGGPAPTAQHVVGHHISVARSALESWCIYFPCCLFGLKAFQRFILFFFEQKSLEHLLDSAFHLLTCPLKARQSQDNTEADNFYQIVAASITVFYFFLIKLTNGTKREGRKEIFNLQREVIFIL